MSKNLDSRQDGMQNEKVLPSTEAVMADFASRNLKVLHPHARPVAFVLVLVGLLAAGSSLAFLLADKPYVAFAITVFGLILLSVGAIVVRKLTITMREIEAKRMEAEPQDDGAIAVTWDRIVPKTPLAQNHKDAIRNELDHVRNQAFTWLSGNSKEALEATDIAVNLYVPRCAETECGNPYMLKVPDGLQVGLNDWAGEPLQLLPGQAVTGRVFARQKPLVSELTQGDDGLWAFAEHYELSREQEGRVHKDLRWILSMPINISNDASKGTAAVMNVIGLRKKIPRNVLDNFAYGLVSSVEKVSVVLAKCPRTRIVAGQSEG